MPAEMNDKISVLVKEHFPTFYQESGPVFSAFIEAYYEYLEQTDQTIDFSRIDSMGLYSFFMGILTMPTLDS